MPAAIPGVDLGWNGSPAPPPHELLTMSAPEVRLRVLAVQIGRGEDPLPGRDQRRSTESTAALGRIHFASARHRSGCARVAVVADHRAHRVRAVPSCRTGSPVRRARDPTSCSCGRSSAALVFRGTCRGRWCVYDCRCRCSRRRSPRRGRRTSTRRRGMDRVQPHSSRRGRSVRRNTSPSGSGTSGPAPDLLDIRARGERVDDQHAGRLQEDRVDDPVRLVADPCASSHSPTRPWLSRAYEDRRLVDELAAASAGSGVDRAAGASAPRCHAARPRTTRGRWFLASWRATCASTGALPGLAGPPAAASDAPPRATARPTAARTRPNLPPPIAADSHLFRRKSQVGKAALLGVS